jgi:membrane protease YdiL (CAAX protease family)
MRGVGWRRRREVNVPHRAARSYRSGAASYFMFALGWSGVFWGAVSVAGGGKHPPSSPLFLLGGAGPLIAAVTLTLLRETRSTQHDFWIRLVDVRRIGWRWLCTALLVPAALLGLAVSIDLVLGGAPLLPAEHPKSPAALVSLVFFVFWFGPLPEEIGWRGFALDRLQACMTALNSSLLLGMVWALWHLPLFFIPGTYQHGLGLGTIRFWCFISQFLPLSVLMTWIYNSTRRSTLSAVLVHFSLNLCGFLVMKTERVAAFEVLFLTAAAVVVTTVHGRARLSREVR